MIDEFFVPFTRWFVQTYKEEAIKMPSTPEELAYYIDIMEKLGLPGIIWFGDGVRASWGRCPAYQSAIYIGKEKFPTLCYTVWVGPMSEVMHISGPFRGAANDIRLCYEDEFVQAINEAPLYTTHAFTLKNAAGEDVPKTGVRK
jgi:hypothetical protein